jgi:hypothetical protein
MPPYFTKRIKVFVYEMFFLITMNYKNVMELSRVNDPSNKFKELI